MIKKKISDKDWKDWKDFLDNLSHLPNKDAKINTDSSSIKRYKFDFHGYSISDANKKISEIVDVCQSKGILEILIVTGKGIHSKKEKSIYTSDKLTKLKDTLPEFIKSNEELSQKVIRIEKTKKNEGGEGAFIIKLKKL